MIQGRGEKVKVLRAAKASPEGVKNEVVDVDKSL
jgi:hypothetical protein